MHVLSVVPFETREQLFAEVITFEFDQLTKILEVTIETKDNAYMDFELELGIQISVEFTYYYQDPNKDMLTM